MKNSLILAALMIFIVSCQKEKSSPEPETSIDPIPQFSVSTATFEVSSKLLKREVFYTNSNPLLKNIRVFTYDNARRCVEIKIGTIDSSVSNPVFNLKQTLSFSYDNATTLLPASFSSVKTVFPNLVTTFYYKYNNLGRKIKDSVRVKNQAGDPADRVINYEYANDRVYVTPVLTGFPMENNTLDTLSLLTGGNIRKLDARMIQAAGDRFIHYTFTYDQFVSPYNQLNIANSLYFEHSSLGIGYNVPLETHYMGVTMNNLKSWTSGNYTVNFNYLYDADQYPVRKEMFLPGEVNPSQVTLFEY